MKQFTIKVTKCEECPHASYDTRFELNYCTERMGFHQLKIETCKDNQDRLTRTCPMWSQVVDTDMEDPQKATVRMTNDGG